jgi:hypothetical protein
VKQSGRVVYDEAARVGTLTLPGGREMQFANVTEEQFRKLIEKHDARFGRSGDARANIFTR